MIKVNRLDSPDNLVLGQSGDGEDETNDAISYYSVISNSQLPFRRTRKGNLTAESYTAYSSKDVRKQLTLMFNGKCAYCESKVITTSSGDVEHFRPKGGYVCSNSIKKPGYYWLAADWDNLLLACTFCNRTYTHEIVRKGVIIEKVQGKHNQFPVSNIRFRLEPSHGQIYFSDPVSYKTAFDLEESTRLLLRPCTDHVEEYFKYEEVGLILPSDGLDSFRKERAEKSIEILALQRIGLVQAREEKVIQIKAQLARVDEALENYNKYFEESEERRTWFEGILRREFAILLKYTEPKEEYSGLAKYFIDKYFESLT